MKIGILTLPFNNNYGGYLQCYALMTVLKREGHEVELIYRRHAKAPAFKKIVPTLKNIVKVLVGRKVVSIIPNEEKSFRSRGTTMMPFLDNYICPKSKPLYSSKEFVKYVSGRYDAVIVGSDQVWRPDYVSDIRDYFFYGINDENLIRLSYAASFGTENPQFTIDEMKDCSKALSLFNAVSVREDSGIEVLKAFDCKLSSQAQVVLDPTLLLESEDYNAIIHDEDQPSKGKVFCYVLDTHSLTDSVVLDVCNILGKPKYSISDIQKTNAELPSIESWLSAIRDADFVITDSFHGTVFSILFNKPFLVLGNKNRGLARFSTLLSVFDLSSRMVTDPDDIKSIVSNDIVWQHVNEKISENKMRSMQYLIKGIK